MRGLYTWTVRKFVQPANDSHVEDDLPTYKGEGGQHLACGCRDIHAAVASLPHGGLLFMPPLPPTYHAYADEPVAGGIHLDGTAGNVHLQSFSANVFSN